MHTRVPPLAPLAPLARTFCTHLSHAGTRWVTDPGEIIRHYLFGWFLLDALSIAVAAFDILPVANAEGTDSLQSLRSLRMMRILRLIKLVRLLRASRLFQRWETQIAINYSQLSLWSSLIKVCLISHWFACIWGIQVALAERNVGTWVDSFNYCTPVSNFPPNATVRGSPISTYSADDCVPDGPWALYSASAYWAVMTITSIGYGDIHATDNNISEQVLNTLLMLTGAMLWGHVIGTFCGIVATMNPHHAEFNRRMDDLNSYLALNNLPQELRRRLREYLHQTRHLQMASASKEIVTLLSPALQGEVTWAVNKRWLMRVSFFNKAEPEFLVQISLCLSPLVFTPGELAVSGYLYIVHRGIALYGGRVLTSGRVWGEDCIIQSAHLQKKWCARAMNYLEVYMISRDDVLEVAQSFPTTWHIIRKQAVRMAVRRQFILAAKLIAGQKGMSWGGSTSTFDRILDQACSVPIAELRLQGALTSNRVETGPNAPILEPRSRRDSAEEGDGRDLGTGTAPWQPLDKSDCTSRSMASTTTCSKASVRIADLRVDVDGAREVGEMGIDRMPQGGILKAAGLELAPGTALPRPKPILTNYGAKPPAMKRQSSNLPPVTNFAGYMEASPRLSGKSLDGAGGSAHPLLSGSMSGSERWSSRSTTCATSNNLRRSVSHNDVFADAPIRSEIDQVAHLLKAAQLTAASTTPSPGSRSFINRTSQSLAGGKGQSFLKSSSSGGGGGRAYNAPGEDLVKLGEELRSDVSQALAETRDELGIKMDAMSSQISALQRDMHQLLAIMSSQSADAPSSDVDLSFISGARRVS